MSVRTGDVGRDGSTYAPRRRPTARALQLLAGAGMAVAVCGITGACGDRPEETAGYARLGTVDHVAVYARTRHEKDGDYLSVIARDSDGTMLCNGSSGIDSNGPFSLPPVCSGGVEGAPFVYVLPVLKSEESDADLCADAGSPLPSTTLATATDWPVDLVVRIDRTPGEVIPLVAPCRLLQANASDQ